MNSELLEAVQVVVRTLDTIMPAVEKAIGREWDRGNYINGPQFGAALETLRAASVDTLPKGQDRETGLGARVARSAKPRRPKEVT